MSSEQTRQAQQHLSKQDTLAQPSINMQSEKKIHKVTNLTQCKKKLH